MQGKSSIWAFLIILGCGNYMCVATNDVIKLGWSRKAAIEAESVAAKSCSGHGRVYLDGLVDDADGKPVCECHSCFTGSDCSQLVANCPATANTGDPVFVEPFWLQHAESSAVVISGWHRLSYNFPDNSFISEQLKIHIRKLHAVANNAVTQGKYIVFGVGSTQLLSAAVFALSMDNDPSPARIASQSPFYSVYKEQTDYFETANFQFNETLLDGNSSKTINNGGNVIEIVCSPNNPDGNLRKNVLKGASISTIYDHAYYWPHYTPIPAPSDEDLMLFTLSKFTGHAGSRFGWALVKNKTVYENMLTYMFEATIGTSRDTQLRVLQLFKTILQTNGTELFNFAYNTMRHRWKKINQVFSPSKRFTLQKIPPRFCTYYNKVRGPSPAYAWVRCEREKDSNCTKVFEEANILGNEGKFYHVNESYVRLDINGREYDFNLLVQRVADLVSKEK